MAELFILQIFFGEGFFELVFLKAKGTVKPILPQRKIPFPWEERMDEA
jgi:hypothetical protein